IYRRFSWIVRAAPRLSVTFHTALSVEAFDLDEYLRRICRLDFTGAARMSSEYRRVHLLSNGIPARLRRAQRFKPVSLIVHTRRELSQMKYVHGLRNVYDHPLSFLAPTEAQAIRANAARADFPILEAVPGCGKLVGVFGFLGRYKGFETV